MGYPFLYRPKTNFAQADEVDPVKVSVEFANIAESLNQTRDFIRALATADKQWQPSTLTTMTLTEAFEYSATAGQTEFVFTGSFTLDPAMATARVFADGLRLDPSDVTLAADRVTIPAQTLGTVVVVEVYEGGMSIRQDLASTDVDLGASLIGVEDPGARWSATNVEGVLTEIDQDVVALTALVTPILGAVLKDGTVPFEADQSMGDNKLTDVADATDPGDAVNYGQLTVLSDLFTALDTVFLALAGGTMSGPINMATNKVTNLGTPTAAGDATNKTYVDTALAALDAAVLALNGLADSTATGTLTGPVSYGAAATDNADADQTTDPGAVAVPTFTGIPRPTEDSQAANKLYVDEEIEDLETRIEQGFDFNGNEQDGAGAAPDLSAGGVYNFTSLTVSGGSSQTVAGPLRIFASGAVTISTALTITTGRLEIYADGAITVSAAVAASAGKIVLKSLAGITVNAAVTASDTLTIEAQGAVTVSAALGGSSIRVASFTDNVTSTTAWTATNASAADAGDAEFAGGLGAVSVDSTGGSGGGGGGIGGGAGGAGQAGSGGTGGVAGSAAETEDGHALYQWEPQVGAGGGAGSTGAGGKGGGIIDVYCAGNLNLSGAVLDAGGTVGAGNGTAGVRGGGGGGGGTIRAVTKGTLTDGTFNADGGNGGDGDPTGVPPQTGGDGGSGGGGGAFLVASAYAGTQTIDVTGGAFGSGGAGDAGTAITATLTAAQIQALFEQGVFDAAF